MLRHRLSRNEKPRLQIAKVIDKVGQCFIGQSRYDCVTIKSGQKLGRNCLRRVLRLLRRESEEMRTANTARLHRPADGRDVRSPNIERSITAV